MYISSYGRKDYSLHLSYQAHVAVPETLFMGKRVKHNYANETRTCNIWGTIRQWKFRVSSWIKQLLAVLIG